MLVEGSVVRAETGIEFDSQITEEINRIRAEVERDGGTTVGCEQLRILCPDEMTVSEQFMRIAQIAQKERWSFAFLVGGEVRFGAYATQTGK